MKNVDATLPGLYGKKHIPADISSCARMEKL